MLFVPAARERRVSTLVLVAAKWSQRFRRTSKFHSVDWFNNRRLLAPIGYVPPAEYEAQYYAQASTGALSGSRSQQRG